MLVVRGYKPLIDGTIVLFGAWFAYFARFESIPPGIYASQALLVAPLLALLRVAVLHRAGAYRRWWRFTSLDDAIQLGASHVLVTFGLISFRFVAPHSVLDIPPVPLSVIGIEGLFALGGGAAVRAIARSVRERRSGSSANAARRVLLVGAGREGCVAARGLMAHSDAGYAVLGFLDDAARRGEVVGGIEVLGTRAELPAVASRMRADLAVLTGETPSARALQDFLSQCKQAGISAHTVPALPDLLAHGVATLRPLDLSSLLGREEVGFCARSWDRVLEAVEGKRILVTGAGGSIGSELCRQLAELRPECLVLLDNSENNLFEIDNEIRRLGRDVGRPCLADIRRREDLERVFAEHEPHVVFHAAAFKHVPMMEFHPSAGVTNNIKGTRLLTEVAAAHGVSRLVMVSTDKAVRPTNVMGATKQVAERIVQASDGRRACVVRFGNVLGSRGSVFHTFSRQIDRGGPITVTDRDITRFFMTIPEAVRLVIQAMAVSEGGEVFLLEMGAPVRIVDLARRMIEVRGADENIPIVFTGLRPGEKLHEELLYETEQTIASDVEGLLVARGGNVDALRLRRSVVALENAASKDDDLQVRALLAAFTGSDVISSHRSVAG